LQLASWLRICLYGVMPPDVLKIDVAKHAEWEQLQRVNAEAASAFYFENILPSVVEHHQRHVPELSPCELLVSLMGFSPETTVIATAMIRPRRLVIIASRNAERYCKLSMKFLTKHHLLTDGNSSVQFVDPTNHRALYAMLNMEITAAGGRRIVDLTGGKKIMSAVAGFAAWSIGVPVCYLESRRYNEQTRRPEPGSEELVILESPVPPRP
jgi:hypothetical protein